MKLNRSLGFILLSVWLILTGVLKFVPIGGEVVSVIMSILAIAAGVLILISR